MGNGEAMKPTTPRNLGNPWSITDEPKHERSFMSMLFYTLSTLVCIYVRNRSMYAYTRTLYPAKHSNKMCTLTGFYICICLYMYTVRSSFSFECMVWAMHGHDNACISQTEKD